MYESLPWDDFYQRAIRCVRTTDLQDGRIPTVPEIADYCGMSRSRLRKWALTGEVPMRGCDELATRLGFHPAAIWGDAWWDLTERWIKWESSLPPSRLAHRKKSLVST